MTTESKRPERDQIPGAIAGAFFLLLLAGFGTFVAYAIWVFNCSEGCYGSETKSWQASAQLVIAGLGLLAALCTVWFTAVGSKRRAFRALCVTLLLYALWGLLILTSGSHSLAAGY
jgi:hypothetical protein